MSRWSFQSASENERIGAQRRSAWHLYGPWIYGPHSGLATGNAISPPVAHKRPGGRRRGGTSSGDPGPVENTKRIWRKQIFRDSQSPTHKEFAIQICHRTGASSRKKQGFNVVAGWRKSGTLEGDFPASRRFPKSGLTPLVSRYERLVA